MIGNENSWIESYCRITDIDNELDTITFDWTRDSAYDYIRLSEGFYDAASIIANSIIEDYNDYLKCDEWSFPALYLYRQAIELLCKGLLIGLKSKRDAMNMLNNYKHNIKKAFDEYLLMTKSNVLSDEEINWVNEYLYNLEEVDSKSDLFRYPIKDGYLNNYKNDLLDVISMFYDIDQCYLIIYKCVDTKYEPNEYSYNIDLTLNTDFLKFTSYPHPSCWLRTNMWDEGYSTQIDGYSQAAEHLLGKLDKNHWSFMTIAYLIRHAIELNLKCMFFSKTRKCVGEKAIKSNIHSHKIYKELWLIVRDVIEYYASALNNDLELLNVADEYLKELESLDKNGDKFKYPTNYSLDYSLNIEKIDYYHAVNWLINIFNFTNSCLSMLDAIREVEKNFYYIDW